MTTEAEVVSKKKKHKNKKSRKSKFISFDDEVVTKEDAKEILLKSEIHESTEVEGEKSKKKKNKKKKDKSKSENNNEESQTITTNESEGHNIESELRETLTETQEQEEPPKKKKKRNQLKMQEAASEQADSSNQPASKNTESIRAQKRKKHAKLLEEKKLKAELAMQQKTLNYLSKWKHSRSDWKFEKLKQIWLQQNMFDSSKIPDEFWETLMEYLSNSKGKSRDAILKDALKIIEKAEEAIGDGEEWEATEDIEVKRARDIIQYLQE